MRAPRPRSYLPEAIPPLVRWCADYGLLGVLPHRAHAVHLAPRWDQTGDGPLHPAQRRFIRTSLEWREYVDHEADMKSRRSRGNRHELVPPNETPRRFHPPGPLIETFYGPEIDGPMRFGGSDFEWQRIWKKDDCGFEARGLGRDSGAGIV